MVADTEAHRLFAERRTVEGLFLYFHGVRQCVFCPEYRGRTRAKHETRHAARLPVADPPSFTTRQRTSKDVSPLTSELLHFRVEDVGRHLPTILSVGPPPNQSFLSAYVCVRSEALLTWSFMSQPVGDMAAWWQVFVTLRLERLFLTRFPDARVSFSRKISIKVMD